MHLARDLRLHTCVTTSIFVDHPCVCRIGLVLVVTPDSVVDATKDAGVAMVRAFNFVNAQDGPAKALSFITDVSGALYVCTVSHSGA